MRRLSALLVVSLATFATSAFARVGDKPAKEELTCVRWWAEVRPIAYGYDHVVHLDNQCTKRARCAVSTDVNPEPTSVDLDVKEQKEVLTWRGSPASTFVATVHCTAL